MRVGDKDTYVVWIYREINMLSNVLVALCYYKRVFGEYWPAKIVVRESNRLSVGMGEDTLLEEDDWNLLDAMYMLTHEPLADRHGGERVPTIFNGKRRAVGVAFRDRRAEEDE